LWTAHPRGAAQNGEVETLDRRNQGLRAEARASALLEQAGFTVLERNWRCRLGELDVVARRKDLLVVAEVRLRSSEDFGGAAGSITAAKRRRIVRAARHLLRSRPELARLQARFDILLLRGSDGPIEWIEAAFDAG
jgi:putative endonuclease